MGVKALECNFNPRAKTYNPHLHLIVANKAIADILIKEWLRLWRNGWTYKGAQFSRKVENTERDLIEIVKYGSKIFTEPDVNEKLKLKGNRNIHVAALDNIFRAMKGFRIFERFGFNLPKENNSPIDAKMIQEYEEWVFEFKKHDWHNRRTDETLSNYEPPFGLTDLLENNIDTCLE